MLLKDTYELKLKQTVQKILVFSTAYNSTYVYCAVVKPGQDESIVHVDKEGNILYEKIYPDIIDTFAMINER